MRKILYGTTALAAAALIGMGSAQAADPVKLKLGGFSNWWVGYAKNDSSYQRAAGKAANDLSKVDVQGDNEIWFVGETTLDNGLKVGVQIELEAGGSSETQNTNGSTDVIDQSWVYLESKFGKFEVGSTSPAAAKLHVSAPTAGFAGLQDGDWGNWVLNPQAAITTNTTGNVSDLTNTYVGGAASASETISYFTPAFMGLTGAVGFIPTTGTEDRRGVADNSSTNGSAWNAGIGYKQEYKFGLTIQAAVEYLNGKQTTLTKWNEWAGGLQLTYAGFTLGGSYKNSDQKANRNAVNNGTATTDGANWDVGIGYATGPYTITLGYYQSDVEGVSNVAANDKVRVWSLGGDYAMSPGVNFSASIFTVDYKDEGGAAANKNEGWAAITGMRLTF